MPIGFPVHSDGMHGSHGPGARAPTRFPTLVLTLAVALGVCRSAAADEGCDAAPVRPAPVSGVDDTVRTEADAAATSRRGWLDIAVPTEAVSVLATFELADPTHVIGITRVTAPDGSALHESRFAADSWETRAHASALAAEALVGTGDLALFLPVTPRLPLRPGRYRVAFETDPPEAALARVGLATKSPPAGMDIDALVHRIDLRVTVLHPAERFRDGCFEHALDGVWRRALDEVLAPHGLGIGAIDVVVAGVATTARFAELDGEAEIAAACRTARRGARRRGSGSAALHVALVAEIVDAESDDWTTGLAPQPGLPYADGSPNGCVFVAERPWSVDGDGSPDADAAAALMAANLLHELGHFASLAHTSEADGLAFDPLDDTPRCEAATRDGRRPDREHGSEHGTEHAAAGGEDDGAPDGIVDERECAAGGGADNLMFWSGDADSGPWTLTSQQAWVLRRHPLFRRLAR